MRNVVMRHEGYINGCPAKAWAVQTPNVDALDLYVIRYFKGVDDIPVTQEAFIVDGSIEFRYAAPMAELRPLVRMGHDTESLIRSALDYMWDDE